MVGLGLMPKIKIIKNFLATKTTKTELPNINKTLIFPTMA